MSFLLADKGRNDQYNECHKFENSSTPFTHRSGFADQDDLTARSGFEISADRPRKTRPGSACRGRRERVPAQNDKEMRPDKAAWRQASAQACARFMQAVDHRLDAIGIGIGHPPDMKGAKPHIVGTGKPARYRGERECPCAFLFAPARPLVCRIEGVGGVGTTGPFRTNSGLNLKFGLNCSRSC